MNLQRHHASNPLLVACALVALVAALAVPRVSLAAFPHPNPRAYQPQADRPPVLAYYYIWYDQRSWNRAKTDYPLLGRYSSDEAKIMRQHIRWAKEAGISGFIVSWKNTDVLRPRLEQLVEVARSEDFKLAIIYQGLDFERNPQPIDRIASDLDFFIESFGDDPVFRIYERPLVIWSGTWKFSHEEIATVTGSRRDQLLLLASEKSVEGYEQIAELVDGDAYYWSSVDPSIDKAHRQKLEEMGAAIHQMGGLWIAPAAPGFDARLVGGTRVVPRNGGETLRQQFDAALSSAPDAVGLISWNEFSENSQIEPSCVFGSSALEVVASILGKTAPEQLPRCGEGTPVAGGAGSTPPAAGSASPESTPNPTPDQQAVALKVTFDSDVDSSSPGGRVETGPRLAMIGLFAFLAFGCITLFAQRSRRRYVSSPRMEGQDAH
jgi:hypothetical protein